MNNFGSQIAFYLGSNSEIETVALDATRLCDEDDAVAADVCAATELTKAGFVGSGNVIAPVESIKFTVDIDGRSNGLACVHSSAT